MNTVKFTGYTIGVETFKSIPAICETYGNKIQPIGGKTALETALPELKLALKDTGIKLLEPLHYGDECTYENMESLCSQIKSKDGIIIAGVGGGKAIDTAKGVADMLNLPVISIPTIAATCAATTKISVLYDSNHKFTEFMYFDYPPIHTFINTSIIANAPMKYLRAGMGDALAKYYECTFSARGEELNFRNGLGRTISHLCSEPLFTHGSKALSDCNENIVSESLDQVILVNIVNTGMVSLLVDDKYNGGVAHSIFYGLTLLPHIEENYLHGDVVAYGILVQLMIDNDIEEAKKVFNYLRDWGCPVSLSDIEVATDIQTLAPILKETVIGPDMEHIPYIITEEMVYEGMLKVEELKEF